MDGEPAVVHAAPTGRSAHLPCCGRDVSGLHAGEQVTTDPSLVTCDPGRHGTTTP